MFRLVSRFAMPEFTSGISCILLAFIGAFLMAVTNGQEVRCSTGYYGKLCRQSCSMNCVSMDCNNVTGACLGGCKDGWTGDMCDQPCGAGSYGYNCSKPCPSTCTGGACDPENGTCTTGCVPGYTGSTCSAVCIQGTYGKQCKRRCPNNCATAECHHQSGYCLKGCKKDFWGSDCSLFGEFKENPEPSQARFYSQLSAESRSVLLYVLMGEYERTLARAQMEIRTGIQQRNQLSRLLGAPA